MRAPLLIALALAAALAALPSWAPTATAADHGLPHHPLQPAETPIVDPQPQPRPLHLPALLRSLSPTEPPPLTPEASGFLAALTLSGRRACAPATHVLLTGREGSAGNTVVAVLFADREQPALNLDLYVSDYVVVAGLEDETSAECRSITRRLIEVREIRSITVPPGRLAAGRYPSVGKRISTATE